MKQRLLLILLCAADVLAAADRTSLIERQTHVSRGVVVVIGEQETLVDEFAASGRWLVHWPVDSEAAAAQHRDRLARQGLGGRVHISVMGQAGQLPVGDRFANLIVMDRDDVSARRFTDAELQRVLAVRGSLWIRRDGAWQAETKPDDDKIDGWFSRWYDATGNCVSRDRSVGPPVSIQWQHGPAMEDGTADGKIVRVADGYAIFLTAGSGELVCRDAGNGTLLWKRFVGVEQTAEMVVCAGRVHLWHEVEAEPTGDRKSLRERGVLSAFALQTGKLVQQYTAGLNAGTASPVEWEYRDERGDTRTRRQTPVPWFTVNERVVVQAYARDLVVLDRVSGKQLWRWQCGEDVTWFSPVVSGDRLLAYEVAHAARRGRHDGSSLAPAITAFSLTSGRQLWRREGLHREYPIRDKELTYLGRAEVKPLSLAGENVLVQTSSYQFRQGGSVAVLDAATGEERWRHRFQPKERYTQGSYRAVLRGQEVVLMCGVGITRFDLGSGEVIENIPPPRQKREARTNGACTASRATDSLLLANAYFFLGDDGQATTNFGARGQCGQGLIPAHGLIFVPPTACDCGDYTRGYQALTSTVPGHAIAAERRLITRGKAAGIRPTGWTHFLGGSTRTSTSSATLPAELRIVWKAAVGSAEVDPVSHDRQQSERWLGALSAPTATESVVVVSLPERHEVAALNAADGAMLWREPTIGKVDSPPTLSHGLAIYGTDAGYVTARNLHDGKAVWQFLAAPTDGIVLHHGHLASPHPLPGSVLVLGDRVIAVAGHHTDLGGLHVYAVEAATGKVVASRVIDASLPGVIANGILVGDADGSGFWLGSHKSQMHLTPELVDISASRDNEGASISFDRQGTRIRFRTADGRGGSTHGWKQAMQTPIGGLRAHRAAIDRDVAFGLQDPTSRMRHPVNAGNTPVLVAMSGTWRDKKQLWALSPLDLGNPESLSALIKVGDRLYVGGGKRDGSAGFVAVVHAKTGKFERRWETPARVTECGLAAVAGRLLVCCENGALLCFAGE